MCNSDNWGTEVLGPRKSITTWNWVRFYRVHSIRYSLPAVTPPASKNRWLCRLAEPGSAPVNVDRLSGPVKAVAAGTYFTCALVANGEMKCWGKSEYGQLGFG